MKMKYPKNIEYEYDCHHCQSEFVVTIYPGEDENRDHPGSDGEVEPSECDSCGTQVVIDEIGEKFEDAAMYAYESQMDAAYEMMKENGRAY